MMRNIRKSILVGTGVLFKNYYDQKEVNFNSLENEDEGLELNWATHFSLANCRFL